MFENWNKIAVLADDGKEIATLINNDQEDEVIKVAEGYVVKLTPKTD